MIEILLYKIKSLLLIMSYQIPFSPTNESSDKTRIEPPKFIVYGKRIIKKNPNLNETHLFKVKKKKSTR